MITQLIPDELHVGVIGLFGTIGGAGAAATPFVLGALSDKVRLDVRYELTAVRFLGYGTVYVCRTRGFNCALGFRAAPQARLMTDDPLVAPLCSKTCREHCECIFNNTSTSYQIVARTIT